MVFILHGTRESLAEYAAQELSGGDLGSPPNIYLMGAGHFGDGVDPRDKISMLVHGVCS